jgi:hypothetical protein
LQEVFQGRVNASNAYQYGATASLLQHLQSNGARCLGSSGLWALGLTAGHGFQLLDPSWSFAGNRA